MYVCVGGWYSRKQSLCKGPERRELRGGACSWRAGKNRLEKQVGPGPLRALKPQVKVLVQGQ